MTATITSAHITPSAAEAQGRNEGEFDGDRSAEEWHAVPGRKKRGQENQDVEDWNIDGWIRP